MSLRTRLVFGVPLVIVLALAAGAVGFLGTRAARGEHRAVSPVAAGPTPSAVASATLPPMSPGPSSPAPLASPAGVAAALAGPLDAATLSGGVSGTVLDPATGTVLFDRNAGQASRPASTTKIVTAAATLSVLPATGRITTRVVAGSKPGEVVLIGAGDPTLSAAPATASTPYPDAARLSTLAAGVRAWAGRSHVTVRDVVVDDSLFTGPATSPDWDAEDVPSSYASAITPLMADGGRDTPDAAIRSASPNQSAAAAFAHELGITTISTGTAPAGAATVASVQSAPYSTLIAQMLQDSDDVVAECLGRQVALADHQPASFAGETAALRSVLGKKGVDIGAGLADASGLAETADTLSAATLGAVLKLAATGPDQALRWLISGLPVGGWSGTLQNQYVDGAAAAAAGAVRAKTGSLPGVNGTPGVASLAGLMHDKSGRLLIFAFIADHLPQGQQASDAAHDQLDVAAASLFGCGCG